MKKVYLIEVIKSNYSKLIFILGFIGSYFLLPQKVFYDGYSVVAVLFMLSFGLTFACLVRNLKEHIFASHIASGSIISAIATIVGLSAMQLCGITLPACGTSIGFSILSVLLPSVLLNFLMTHALAIVVASIILQVFSLWQMNCFNRTLVS